MANHAHVEFVLPLLFMLLAGSEAVLCTTKKYNSFTRRWYYDKTYCSGSRCCGYYPYQKCCYDNDAIRVVEKTWRIWAIVGGVIGGIVLISVIIAVVCIVRRRQFNRGQVIRNTAMPPPNPALQPATAMPPPNPALQPSTVAYSGASAQYPMQYTGYPAPGPGNTAPYPPPAYPDPPTAGEA